MNWRNWPARLIGTRTNNGLDVTPQRVRAAYGVAIATDVLQFALGPLGWMFADEILDAIALVATTRLLGFHPLLLPSFLLELLPVADMLPTWTGCVALVVAIRKKQAFDTAAGDVRRHTIDVKPTRVT
jgi:hypothetical protein